MSDPIVLALRYLLGDGFFSEVFLLSRPAKWEVTETKLYDDPPAGDGWEPFGSTDVSGTTWIQWRRPA